MEILQAEGEYWRLAFVIIQEVRLRICSWDEFLRRQRKGKARWSTSDEASMRETVILRGNFGTQESYLFKDRWKNRINYLLQ